MRLLKILLNTLFPPVCVSCKREGDFLCLDCLKSLDKKKIRSNSKKYDDPDLHHLDGVIYALDDAKNPQIKAAVKQFKYRFTQDLADLFGNLIAEKIGELSMVKNRRIILIPVPLHKKRLNYRGFNQAEVIARAVANKIPDGKAEVINILDRVRATEQQAKLDKAERHENLKGAFRISNQFCHSDRSGGMNTKFTHEQKSCSFFDSSSTTLGVAQNDKLGFATLGHDRRGSAQDDKSAVYFLVDDVCTTGSTLENCAQVLKSEFPIRVYGLVIARQYRSRAVRMLK